MLRHHPFFLFCHVFCNGDMNNCGLYIIYLFILQFDCLLVLHLCTTCQSFILKWLIITPNLLFESGMLHTNDLWRISRLFAVSEFDLATAQKIYKSSLNSVYVNK